jgi:hypothetical protein
MRLLSVAVVAEVPTMVAVEVLAAIKRYQQPSIPLVTIL